MQALRALLVPLLLVAAGCHSLEYDLSELPMPVSAKPASGESVAEAFTIQAKHISWVHGLLGKSKPDVAALILERARGCKEITDFRVRHEAGFHEWLVTHMTLTLIRMKTVVIEGRIVR